MAQCAEQLQSRSYDVIVVEYPSPGCKASQILQVLHQAVPDLPVIFLTAGLGGQSILELGAEDLFKHVEHEHLSQLPMAVRRALNGEELEEARRALRHSQSLYRALADNPTYGIYRCDAEGELLDVNQALVMMLGYTSKVELLAANHESEIIPNLRNDSLFAGSSLRQSESSRSRWNGSGKTGRR